VRLLLLLLLLLLLPCTRVCDYPLLIQ